MDQPHPEQVTHMDVSEPWERELLALARQTIECYVESGLVPVTQTSDPHLREPAAVFVTLRTRSTNEESEDELRGCVGQIEARAPLYAAVQDAAVQAATCDPRFVPVRPEELPALRIEISILSPMTVVSDLDSVVIGRDGLLIAGMGRRGLLLPSVPVQFGWDREAFLRGMYMKSGLPEGSWPARATLYSFTTQHISE